MDQRWPDVRDPVQVSRPGRNSGSVFLALFEVRGFRFQFPADLRTLIETFGFIATGSAYCVTGSVLTIGIGVRWRAALWRSDATSNARYSKAQFS